MTSILKTLDQIRAIAPSVFANNPFPGVSNRYAFIPTANVVEQMMAEGWGVRDASQSYTRLDDHRGFQKHMIRFARVEDINKVNSFIAHANHHVDRENPLAEFPEVVLTNSHDGTSTYQLHAGIFRLVCANGLIIADATFARMRIRHTGNANEIVGASYEILEDAPRLMGQVAAMKQIELSNDERTQFALGGAMARYGFKTLGECPIDHTRLLDAHRPEDRNPTLWNTLNVVQENLMKGRQNIRLGGAHVTETGRWVFPKRTMAIKAVDATMKVNKSLWAMAGELLAAKS